MDIDKEIGKIKYHEDLELGSCKILKNISDEFKSMLDRIDFLKAEVHQIKNQTVTVNGVVLTLDKAVKVLQVKNSLCHNIIDSKDSQIKEQQSPAVAVLKPYACCFEVLVDGSWMSRCVELYGGELPQEGENEDTEIRGVIPLYREATTPRITEQDVREVASALRDIVANYECGDAVDKKLTNAINKLNADKK